MNRKRGQSCPEVIVIVFYQRESGIHGLLDISKIKKSDTVLVSTAAGSVGMFACQIAKLTGCKVLGLSGTANKCQWVEKKLGDAACLNYKDPRLVKNLKEACQDVFHVYFDNVGGSLLEKVLYLMKMNGRVTCCGAISQYDANSLTSPRNVPGIIITKRLKLEGFIVTDFLDQRKKAVDTLTNRYNSGVIKVFIEKYKGLEKAPEALTNLLQGKNLGKTIIQV